MRLDNAALIFPAIRQRHWVNVFRLSATLNEPIDPATLQAAVDDLKPRFPSMYVRLKTGLFWYYLEEIPGTPQVREDYAYPLVLMQEKELHACCLRVTYFQNRIAVEFFHSLTDGNGGLVFLKTLTARYLERKTGARIPAGEGVLDWQDKPAPEELEDSFQRNVGPVAAPRDDGNVYRYRGTLEPDRFLHVTLGTVDSEALHSRSHALGVTVTAYLTAVLLQSLLELQAENVPRRQRRKNVKIQIPVNLRKLYDSRTMRNFVAVANVGVDPRLGDYTLEELAKLVHHQMHLSITPKNMQAIFTPNVTSEQNPVLKIVPLFLKNIIMRAVFDTIGERVASMTLSNLGRVELPEAMAPFVERVEFVLGPQSTAPYNASVTSWQGKTFINIVRNTVEPRLEEIFFTKLVKLGCRVTVESNDRA
jgi:NRPS condensation-like uncharacterized protein